MDIGKSLVIYPGNTCTRVFFRMLHVRPRSKLNFHLQQMMSRSTHCSWHPSINVKADGQREISPLLHTMPIVSAEAQSFCFHAATPALKQFVAEI
jgi:hypothetical protein